MTVDAANGTSDLEIARSALSAFLAGATKDGRTAAIHDSDADGVTAGVIWQRAMERLGFTRVLRVIPDRERNAWSPANRARVAETNPQSLYVLDLGSQPEPILDGVRICFIDHHRPEG